MKLKDFNCPECGASLADQISIKVQESDPTETPHEICGETEIVVTIECACGKYGCFDVISPESMHRFRDPEDDGEPPTPDSETEVYSDLN